MLPPPSTITAGCSARSTSAPQRKSSAGCSAGSTSPRTAPRQPRTSRRRGEATRLTPSPSLGSRCANRTAAAQSDQLDADLELLVDAGDPLGGGATQVRRRLHAMLLVVDEH